MLVGEDLATEDLVLPGERENILVECGHMSLLIDLNETEGMPMIRTVAPC